jgi:hypothetical protein
VYVSLDDALSSAASGVERPFNCPVHDDQNASASVNITKGVWYCYACHAKGRVDKKKTTPSDAALQAAMEGKTEPAVHSHAYLGMFCGKWWDTPSPYFVDRFGPDVATRFCTGTHPYTAAPVYPVFSADALLWGVVSRGFPGEPKYIYPAGVPMSRCMFGYKVPTPWSSHVYNKYPETVILVEGATDVMGLRRVMFGNHTVGVFGIYGSGIHRPQVEMVLGCRPKKVIIALDADAAGRSGAEHAEKVLTSASDGSLDIVSVDYSSIGATDGADASEDGLVELFSPLLAKE